MLRKLPMCLNVFSIVWISRDAKNDLIPKASMLFPIFTIKFLIFSLLNLSVAG
jgi:hypothetical protein